MRQHLQTTALAALFGLVAADVSAQQRPSTAAVAEWRAPLPRTELHGRYQGAELYAVEFLNHNVGWAVGGHSGTHSTIVFRTNDGGKTWERQTMFDGESHGTFFQDIGFADANNGWIAGRYHILRTIDGGESWAPVNRPQHSGAPMDPWAEKLLVLGPDAIIVGSNRENGQIWRTLDGGATWDVVALVEGGGGGAGSNNTVSGLALAEPSTVFATTGTYHGNRGVIYRSNDGGLTWEVVEEADQPLLGIAFRGRRGVAVGKNIAFWTEDGGSTWRRVSIPGIQIGVDFADDNTVVAVGNRPYVVISRNGGRTWQQFAAPPSQGNLVDIDAVDPGWWFVAGGYGANALFHYVDPNHTEPIATGTLPLPVDVQLPGGSGLPRGLYDVTLGHKGDQHVVQFDRRGEVPPNTPPPQGLENATTQQSGRRPPTCASPCRATLPGTVTYEKENAPGAGRTGGAAGGAGAGGAGAAAADLKSFFFRLTLEPTANGVAVVMRTAVTPPRNVALALAAVGARRTTEREARPAAEAATERAGGLLGRARRAAAGDVRGAVAGSGINPQASQQRLRAAKAAPPAVYKLTLRHSLDLFGPRPSGGSQ